MFSDTDLLLDRTCIGRGSFGSVHTIHGGPLAYKQVLQQSDADVLLNEYRALESIFVTQTSHSFFSLPRPYVYYNPEFDIIACNYQGNLEESPYQSKVTKDLFCGFDKACYLMERVFGIPYPAALVIREMYYPQSISAPSPTLCRLYFGKVLDVDDDVKMKEKKEARRPRRFFTSANFPLDVKRYAALAVRFPCLPAASAVAYGMGEMLGRIHRRGYDGSDIEFVLGGDGFVGFRFVTIDFNQMRTNALLHSPASARGLAVSFFRNDPYYPRPRTTDTLYLDFRRGYLAAWPHHVEAKTAALAFLAAIEEEQLGRDAAKVSVSGD
ncbi:hypothetical protein Hypma_001190 [Hypsizygus marmoreus]|uniref:DUF3669 domain-containing protein n=1 Tax=Hypsizygus marmoreus TaxID=39966 RepID=A0A369JDA1_HYPMA|nr:hypothetical protein Hypma_001190 [Hypsizygus marmoreus]